MQKSRANAPVRKKSKSNKKFIVVTLLVLLLLGIGGVLAVVLLPSKNNDNLTVASLVVTAPDKTDYLTGEKFDSQGLVVQHKMSDDSTLTLDSDKYILTINNQAVDKNTEFNDIGNFTIKVVDIDTEKNAEFSITVVKETVVIKTQPTKTDYYPTDTELDLSGLSVIVTSRGNKQEEITYTAQNQSKFNYTLPIDWQEPSDKTIALSYDNIDCGLVSVRMLRLAIKSVELDEVRSNHKKEYTPRDNFTPSGLVVKVTYVNDINSYISYNGNERNFQLIEPSDFKLSQGAKAIDAKYLTSSDGNFVFNLAVNMNDAINTFDIATQPTNLEYAYGTEFDSLDYNGLSIVPKMFF